MTYRGGFSVGVTGWTEVRTPVGIGQHCLVIKQNLNLHYFISKFHIRHHFQKCKNAVFVQSFCGQAYMKMSKWHKIFSSENMV